MLTVDTGVLRASGRAAYERKGRVAKSNKAAFLASREFSRDSDPGERDSSAHRARHSGEIAEP